MLLAQELFTTFVLVAVCAVAQAESSIAVGEVSLVLGEAYRQSTAGARERLERGSKIAVGDKIGTLSNGHVHVRFVDNALVSVRPSSLLVVQRYDYHADSPADSTVKFELQEGVTRAISGEAAKSARNRFRLNTPIAAIGVRGTDFAVSVGDGVTRAIVNEGVIVMAPYSEACSVDALGPCLANSLEVTRSSLQLASMQQNDTFPRFLPPQSMRAPSVMQEEVQLAIARSNRSSGTSVLVSPRQSTAIGESKDTADQEVSNDVLLEGVTTVNVRADAKVVVDSVAAIDFIPADPIVVAGVAGDAVALFDLTPPTLLTSSELRDRQLVWGRYANAPLSTDRLALPLEDAAESRRITVGNLGYGLFRAEPGPRRIASDLGLVGFQLTSAQAVFNSSTGVVAMTVNGGNLDINFQENAFSTALELSSGPTGSVLFTANGRVADGGFLQMIEATQRVAGAVSFDGAEAGYLFEKQIEDGAISGLTLWEGQ